jgi:hypothetical protein
MPKKSKRPENYTSRELLTYWKEEFSKHNSKDYASLRFGGLDLSDFKDLLNRYDVFQILLAIIEGARQGTIISEFHDNFKDYDADSPNPRIEWLVRTKGTGRQKQLWARYEMHAQKWFPKGSDLRIANTAMAELEEWAS